VIERYLQQLALELAQEGVRGRAAKRVVAEARDHLLELEAEHGERGAVAHLGKSATLARAVAVQLATTWTRRATYGAFLALALTGIAYLAVFAVVNLGGGWPDLFGGDIAALGVGAVIGATLFPQVAFVSGCLALLRAFRLRAGHALPAGELRVMRSRAAIALVAAALTWVCLALFAIEFRDAPPLEPWVPAAVLGLCVAAAIALACGAIALARSARPSAAAGPRVGGDVFDDLGPIFELPLLRGLRAHPWRFAAIFAGAVAFCAFAMGIASEGDPQGAVLQAFVEGLAVLASFALLGRPLALRR
jgi:hypothetical protein